MSTLSSMGEDTEGSTSPRKRSTRVACCHCRKRKHACDALRPTCTPCARRNLECVYDTQDDSETRLTALRRQLGMFKEQTESSQEQLGDVAELFHLLKAIPEDKAVQLLKRVRASRDPVASMSSLRRSMLQSRTFGGEAVRESPPQPMPKPRAGSFAGGSFYTSTNEHVPDENPAVYPRPRASSTVLRDPYATTSPPTTYSMPFVTSPTSSTYAFSPRTNPFRAPPPSDQRYDRAQ